MTSAWLTCRDADRLLSRRRDTHLPLGERWTLWLHLRYCRNCRTASRNLDLLTRSVRRFDS